METAGEGGAWGIALLATYRRRNAEGKTRESYLDQRVFASQPVATLAPDPADVTGFATFMARYRQGLAIERTAVDALEG